MNLIGRYPQLRIHALRSSARGSGTSKRIDANHGFKRSFLTFGYTISHNVLVTVLIVPILEFKNNNVCVAPNPSLAFAFIYVKIGTFIFDGITILSGCNLNEKKETIVNVLCINSKERKHQN